MTLATKGPPTRDGAVAAGRVFSRTFTARQVPLVSLVLRHDAADGRWHLVSSHDRIGFAVGAFKAEREKLDRGALAIWTHERLDRFETVGEDP